MFSDTQFGLVVTVMLKLLMICPHQGSHSVQSRVPHSCCPEFGASADQFLGVRLIGCILTHGTALQTMESQVVHELETYEQGDGNKAILEYLLLLLRHITSSALLLRDVKIRLAQRNEKAGALATVCTLLEYDAPHPQHTNNTCSGGLEHMVNGLGTGYLSSSSHIENASVLDPWPNPNTLAIRINALHDRQGARGCYKCEQRVRK